MTTKIIFLLTLLSYSMIAGQAFMHMLALKHAQLSLEANAYIELRKLVDASMRVSYKYVIYAALLTNILLVLANIKNPGGLVFITAAIALVALIAEILLTLKGNLPINDVINTWSANNYPTNWADFRTKWFDIYQYRQVANIIGFISLLAGVVFGQK